MSNRFNYFVRDGAERVASAVAEVIAAALVLWALVEQTGLLEVDWQTVAVGGPLVVGFTVLKVLAASKLGDKGTAAFDRDPVRHVDTDFHQDDYKE